MQQLWTIIIIILLAFGFSLAAWLDRDEAKRRARHDETYKKEEQTRN
jgi:hypothetical protein